MVRTRWAPLTLAGSLLLTSSGCFCLFERFQAWRQGGADCTCMETGAQAGIPVSGEVPVSGPALVPPDAIFTGPPPAIVPQGPPPAAIPQGPPPRIVPIPAQPMPWTGQH